MKNLTFYLFFLASILASCSVASKTAPSIDLKSFANDNNLKFQEGEGFLKSGNQGEAIVVIYEPNNVQSAKMFVAQGASNFLNATGTFQIAYSDSGIVVKNQDEYFCLSLDANVSYIQNFEKQLNSVKKFKGYGFGLANLNGNIEGFKESLNSKNIEVAFYDNFGKKNNKNIEQEPEPLGCRASDCGAGGQGANACSIEAATFSCSVNCLPNYFACCSFYTGCKCCPRQQ